MADPEQNGILNALGAPNAFSGKPFGLEKADTNLGAFGLGMLEIPSFLSEYSTKLGDTMLGLPGNFLDYLNAPTEYGLAKIDAESKVSESEEKNKLLDAIENEKFLNENGYVGKSILGEFGNLDIPKIDMSGLDVEYQMEQAEKEKARGEAAQAFRANEAQLVDSQGGLNSMSIADSKTVTQEQANEGFLSAMDDFFEASRGAGPEMPKNRTIEEYKKVFSEATGIDTSGEVDKSDALMAFGLALMQNKAGKGFNVGKMLQSVGSAGDKAMPALQKAKERARQGALAGGKYALQTQSADKATRAANKEKMMNRGKYWFYEKGKPGAEFEGFDKGQFENLNKYELNQLINDPEFSKKYEFINASDRFSILEKRAEGLDLGDEWTNDLKNVSLIGGKADELPSALVVAGHPADANYGGKASAPYKLGESEEGVVRRFGDFQTEVNKNEDVIKNLIENLQQGVSFPKQIAGNVAQLAKSLGLNVDTSSTAKAKQALANIAIDNVLAILKESGRTISEGERNRVDKRVSKVDLSLEGSDLNLILNQVEYVYDMVVTKPQRNLDNALKGFEENFGYSISGGSNQKSDKPTQAELDAMNAANNTNLTMADFK